MRDDTHALVAHLTTSTRLSADEAAHVLGEVRAFFAETCEAFVRRRHVELQAAGLGNRDIWVHIARELNERRFAAPVLSERQLRRMVYG